MNIVKRIEQYDENNLFFCEPIKNNIISDSNFIKIIYSTNIMSINGIYFILNFCDTYCEKFYNKYKCSFNVSNNLELIEQIKLIEYNILNKLNFENKIKQFKIYDQLKSGNFKIFCDSLYRQSSKFILKISGIWETKTSYGLTYKFLSI